MGVQRWGADNPNFKHGDYSIPLHGIEIKQALAKDQLQKILTANLETNPPTGEEARWAMRVVRERPEWAKQTLRNLGFKDTEEE